MAVFLLLKGGEFIMKANLVDREQKPKPQADSHYASNRTGELMFQINYFREQRGLGPLTDTTPAYRGDCLKPRTFAQSETVFEA